MKNLVIMKKTLTNNIIRSRGYNSIRNGYIRKDYIKSV